jgi:hypothetical protein
MSERFTGSLARHQAGAHVSEASYPRFQPQRQERSQGEDQLRDFAMLDSEVSSLIRGALVGPAGDLPLPTVRVFPLKLPLRRPIGSVRHRDEPGDAGCVESELDK